MNLLLDTNVIIDYLGRKAPFFENAEKIIAAGYFGDVQLWAPAQSFKDAFYVLAHYADPARIQDAILKLLEIVNPVDLAAGDIVAAARLKWEDFEDCLVSVCAGKAGADFLVTRDSKGFERSTVAPISPADWLSYMREHESLAFDAIDWESAETAGAKD